MSTRAQIIITDGTDNLWFYRHSDGYPNGTLPTLNLFMEWVKTGRIRDNVGQAAGWLILIGHAEHQESAERLRKMYKDETPTEAYKPPMKDMTGMGWKVGSYEPCAPEEHGDIEYLYTVNIATKKISFKTI